MPAPFSIYTGVILINVGKVEGEHIAVLALAEVIHRGQTTEDGVFTWVGNIAVEGIFNPVYDDSHLHSPLWCPKLL